jgi:hypothetical protein
LHKLGGIFTAARLLHFEKIGIMNLAPGGPYRSLPEQAIVGVGSFPRSPVFVAHELSACGLSDQAGLEAGDALARSREFHNEAMAARVLVVSFLVRALGCFLVL